MKILVLVKEVPDTYGSRRLDLETGLAQRAASDRVMDEIGERALEAALKYADAEAGTEVIVVSMSPDGAQDGIRKLLAMGAASAVHIADEQLAGADLGLTAQVLAAAVTRCGFDLVITGNISTDGSGGVLPAMIAERLGVPHATALTELTIAADRVTGVRGIDGGTMVVSAELPAVVSVTEALPDARLANLKGIMGAKKKPYESIGLSELGIDPEDPAVARSIMTAISEKPPRAAGVTIIDEGDGGTKLAEYLIRNRLA